MFGDRLKELREEKGLTQEKLGDFVNLTKANISKYESGKLEPNLDTINLLADFFSVSTDYLFGRTGVRNFECNKLMEVCNDAYTVFQQQQDLIDFWTDFPKRPDYHVLIKQIKNLNPEAVNRLIKYIKIVENEDSNK